MDTIIKSRSLRMVSSSSSASIQRFSISFFVGVDLRWAKWFRIDVSLQY